MLNFKKVSNLSSPCPAFICQRNCVCRSHYKPTLPCRVINCVVQLGYIAAWNSRPRLGVCAGRRPLSPGKSARRKLRRGIRSPSAPLEPRRSLHVPVPLHRSASSIASASTRRAQDLSDTLADRVGRQSPTISLCRKSKKKYAHLRRLEKVRCDLCDVFMNSRASYNDDKNGCRHRAKLVADAYGPRTFRYCKVTVRTKKEFDSHLQSRCHFRIPKKEFGFDENNIKKSF